MCEEFQLRGMITKLGLSGEESSDCTCWRNRFSHDCVLTGLIFELARISVLRNTPEAREATNMSDGRISIPSSLECFRNSETQG